MKTTNSNPLNRITGALLVLLCIVFASQAQNLALGKTGTASSIQSSTYPASKAFDGNATTRWSSASSDPQWIYVDLGTCYRVNNVVLKWETASAMNYTIDVANSATGPWKTVFTNTNMGAGPRTDNVTFQPALARYVRMTGYLRNNTAYGYSLYEMEVYGSAPTQETVLVLTEQMLYDMHNMLTADVDQYVQCLRNEGFTVYFQTYTPPSGLPMAQCKDVLNLLRQYYFSQQINGVVFIGQIPIAEYNSLDYLEDWPTGYPAANDYYYMDLININNKYDVSYHDNAWLDDGYTTWPNPAPGVCDNKVEIWVSRICAANLITQELHDAYGSPVNYRTLVSQYLERLISRMTLPETVPSRAIALNGVGTVSFPGITNFTLDRSAPNGTHPFADNPANWQAQLQSGPYGNLNMTSGHLMNNPTGFYFGVAPGICRTYPGIAADTFGFEWAGIYEHSSFDQNWFDYQNSYFYNTDYGLINHYAPATSNPLPNRTYTSMYLDGGHAKPRFYIDAGCNNANIIFPDCLGQLYAMAGNGLITIGSTMPQASAPIDQIISALANDSTLTFGAAMKAAINGESTFPTNEDILICIGAGTLKPKARYGYSRKYIEMNFSFSVSSVNEAAYSCTGTLTMTSTSPNTSGFTPAATLYNWYDANSNAFLMQTSPTVSYTYTRDPVFYGPNNVLVINGKTIDPNRKYTIEAYQATYLSGYTNLLGSQIARRIPVINDVNISATQPAPPANWWVDNVSGQLQCIGNSPSIAYDNSKSSFKWYDNNGVLQTTITKSVSYSYQGSLEKLIMNGKTFIGNFTINSMQSGYMFDKYYGGFPLYINCIRKKTINTPVTVTTFTPTVNTTNCKFDVAGTTTDVSNGSGTDFGGIVGSVIMPGSAEITAKDTLFLKTGSAEQKAGIWVSGPSHTGDPEVPLYVFFYQKPNGSVALQYKLSKTSPIGAWIVGTYTVGKTWLRMTIDKSSEGPQSVNCFISTDNKTFIPCGGNTRSLEVFNFSSGIMYSSGGTAGSARVVNINFRGY
jgi:hypothetical protein